MSKNNVNDTSLTDWERIDALADEMIDTTDSPPLGKGFFANAELRMPKMKDDPKLHESTQQVEIQNSSLDVDGVDVDLTSEEIVAFVRKGRFSSLKK